MPSTQEQFLQALESNERNSLQNYLGVQGNAHALRVFVFSELLPSLPAKLRIRLCDGLKKKVSSLIAQLNEAGNRSSEEPDDVEENSREAAFTLKALTGWISTVLSDVPNAVPEALLEAAAQLHDECLLGIPDLPALQEATAKLCISWWQANAIGKEQLVAQTLPYMLLKALTSGKPADVKRCHALRGALPLLDFEDEPSIADLKGLLLRAAFCPAFLRLAEGRRFLSSLFLLQPQLTRELAAIIRNQIPAGRASVLSSYGEILQRAWRDASGLCRLELEDIVQGLMQAALVAKTAALNAALRRVLDGFHSQKMHANVEALLLKLYEPILFRALSANNSSIRRNALSVLFDAFPLEDPEASSEARNELMTQQFTAIGTGLSDNCPAVRAVAASGICQVLNTFWELLPAPVIYGFLKQVTGRLAFDSTSPAVRAAAVQGVALLVENPIAQPLLKSLLPSVGRVLWDASLTVRAAFSDLLIAVQKVSDLSVTQLVTPEDLLDSLALESGGSGSRLQQLLLPSYFPNPEEGPSLVAYLLRICPEAGKAFCKCLAGGNSGLGLMLPMEDLLRLAKELKDHLLACAPQPAPVAPKQQEGSPSKGRKRKEAPHTETNTSMTEGEETRESWESILAGLAELCNGLAPGLDVPDEQAASLDIFDADDLVMLLERACSPEGRAAVLAVAAALPGSCAAAAVRERCKDQLIGASLSVSPVELLQCLSCVAADPETSLAAVVLEVLHEHCHKNARAQDCKMAAQAAAAFDLMLQSPELRLTLLPEAAESLRILQASGEVAVEALRGAIKRAAQGRDPRPSLPAGILVVANARLALHARLANKLEADDCEAKPLEIERLLECFARCQAAAEGVLTDLEAISRDLLHEWMDESEDGKSKRARLAAEDDALSCADSLKEAWHLIAGVLATSADATKLLGPLTGPQLHKSCNLAVQLLSWLAQLPTGISQGSGFGPEDALAEALALSASLLCLAIGQASTPQASRVPSGSEGSREAAFENRQHADDSPQNSLSKLAAMVMELGCRSRGAEAPAIRPYYNYLFKSLCSQRNLIPSTSWLRPVAVAVAEEALDLGDSQEDSSKHLDEAHEEVSGDENVEANTAQAPRNAAEGKAGKGSKWETSAGMRPLENRLAAALLKVATAEEVVVEVAEAAVQLSKASLAAADRSVCLGGVQIVYRLIHTDKTRRPHLSRTVRESLEHLLGDAKAKQVDDKTDKLLIASLQDMLSV